MPHRTIRTRMLLSAGVAAAAGVLACGQDSGESAIGGGEAQDAAGAVAAPADGVYSSARHDFRVVTVADGLDHPWSMAWLPDGEMLIVERPGRLRVVRGGVLQPEPVAGWPEVYRDEGQGGFMDILPHPDFAENRWLYLSYGKPNEDGSEGTTTVVRGRWDDGRVTDVEEIFESNAWHDNNNHFSGRMAFGLDGYLYLTVGDRMFEPDMMAGHPALDVTNHMGTIVRLHDDGRVPDDNPFAGSGDALPEIWSYGHRNLQGLAVDPGTGTSGRTSTGPGAATSSTWFRAAATTAGPWSPTASTTTARRTRWMPPGRAWSPRASCGRPPSASPA